MADDVTPPTDEQVLAVLADAFDDLPALPAHLHDFAVSVFAWRAFDDELALVTFDSAVDELTGTRGVAAPATSTVRFEGRGVTVEVVRSPNAVVITVQPPATYRCTIDGPEVALRSDTGDDGVLVHEALPLPLRISVSTPLGRLIGPWITG